MIVLHHNDLDGRCAAAIVYKWYKDNGSKGRLECVAMDYKDAVPLDRIRRDDTVVIVDFSFKPADMEAIMRSTDQGVIWCDHHVTAKDYGYSVAGERDFTNKGLSGCELTWKYYFPEVPTPDAVRLIGDYDAWRLAIPESLAFYEGMKLEDTHPLSVLWLHLLEQGGNQVDILHRGRAAQKYRDNYCEGMRKAFGYETQIDGVPAYAANIFQFGSQGFGELFKKYPVCLAYAHDGRGFTVSLYSETVDVSVIAKKFGGGGHKGAAGFVCSTLPFAPTTLLLSLKELA